MTDLDMYLIQTEELQWPKDDSQIEHEMQLLFAMNHSFCEDSAMLEEERKRMERQEEVLALAKKFKPFNRSDDYRCPNASYYGGFQLMDKTIQSKLRSAGTELIKSAGRQILSGSFNLTRISFPIKCMTHVTMLEIMATMNSCFAIYFNKAAETKDPVEKMKFTIVGAIAYFYFEKIFEKPLNPILGETYEAYGQDGSVIFLEQSCHHPPISHFMIEGPNQNYTLTGWSSYTVKAGMNSANITSDGHKLLVFKDGQRIRFTNYNDLFYNIMMGTMGHQLVGKMSFEDSQNGITASFEFGNVRGKTQDYFSGQILKGQKVVSEIRGNYMGFIDFDKVRYYDIREKQHIHFPISAKGEASLPSDSTRRKDSRILAKADMVAAQAAKEELENLQRNDRKLRETAEKRRLEGGAKIKR